MAVNFYVMLLSCSNTTGPLTYNFFFYNNNINIIAHHHHTHNGINVLLHLHLQYNTYLTGDPQDVQPLHREQQGGELDQRQGAQGDVRPCWWRLLHHCVIAFTITLQGHEVACAVYVRCYERLD